MPTIDPQIVRASALALDRYGPDFSYAPYIAVSTRRRRSGWPAASRALFGARPGGRRRAG